jgi:hypothetical protein
MSDSRDKILALRQQFLRIRDACMEYDLVWDENTFNELCQQQLGTREKDAKNWVEIAKDIALDLARQEYRRIRRRSLAYTCKIFDKLAEKILFRNGWTPRKGINWVKSARLVSFSCATCEGLGHKVMAPTFSYREKKKGAQQLPLKIDCPDCQGKGYQNDADRLRLKALKKLGAGSDPQALPAIILSLKFPEQAPTMISVKEYERMRADWRKRALKRNKRLSP